MSWYQLTGTREPQRNVVVYNQFGRDLLTLGDPEILLAPALKQKLSRPRPGKISRRVSHFKGYKVLKWRNFKPPIRVSLQDQFDTGPKRTLLYFPAYLCVPVEKTIGLGKGEDGKVFPRRRAAEHLLICQLDRRISTEERSVYDQFGGGRLGHWTSSYLAVPTRKFLLKKKVNFNMDLDEVVFDDEE